MAQFLNTTATNYQLEELIKNAQERLILISPFLQISRRIRELLEDKNRLKIDVRIVYGKSKLQEEEKKWLRQMDYIRLSFCENLHAKCYLSENACIITSLNLYQFSQVNNNEMGILVEKNGGGNNIFSNNNPDKQLYEDIYEEAKRLVRISREVDKNEEVSKTKKEVVQASKKTSQKNIEKSVKVESSKVGNVANDKKQADKKQDFEKFTTAKLAQNLQMKTSELNNFLLKQGYLELRGENLFLTNKGKKIGGSFHKGSRGYYFLWPKDFNPSKP